MPETPDRPIDTPPAGPTEHQRSLALFLEQGGAEIALDSRPEDNRRIKAFCDAVRDAVGGQGGAARTQDIARLETEIRPLVLPLVRRHAEALMRRYDAEGWDALGQRALDAARTRGDEGRDTVRLIGTRTRALGVEAFYLKGILAKELRDGDVEQVLTQTRRLQAEMESALVAIGRSAFRAETGRLDEMLPATEAVVPLLSGTLGNGTLRSVLVRKNGSAWNVLHGGARIAVIQPGTAADRPATLTWQDASGRTQRQEMAVPSLFQGAGAGILSGLIDSADRPGPTPLTVRDGGSSAIRSGQVIDLGRGVTAVPRAGMDAGSAGLAIDFGAMIEGTRQAEASYAYCPNEVRRSGDAYTFSLNGAFRARVTLEDVPQGQRCVIVTADLRSYTVVIPR